jgi:SAM-dependent methyltransferase
MRPSSPVDSSQAGRQPFAKHHPPEVIDFVRSVNRSGKAYHRIDFGGGLVMEGRWDMSEHLHRYELPMELAGMTVLDVGTSSGYFAVEFARRGATVTAIDLWDESFQKMVFRAARVDVSYVQMDLFDLDESFGTFDLVFCGSVLMHTWDQFTALQRLRAVCGQKAIVATAIMSPGRLARQVLRRAPIARFVGEKGLGPGPPYWTTWALSPTALTAMAETAGFESVSYRGSFRLGLEHGVLHAYSAESS